MSKLSQIEKISLQNQIDTEFLLQADRIGQESKSRSSNTGLQSGYISGINSSGQYESGVNKPDLYKFTRPEQKIIDEYVRSNYQPYEFEKDANGNLVKKFRYKLPQDEPVLEEQISEKSYIDRIENLKNEQKALTEEYILNQTTIENNNNELNNLIDQYEEKDEIYNYVNELLRQNNATIDDMILDYVEGDDPARHEHTVFLYNEYKSAEREIPIISDKYDILETETQNIKKRQQIITQRLNNIEIEKDTIQRNLPDIQKQNVDINNRNAERINEYSEALRALNRGMFNVDKDPLETEEQYLQRLKQTALMEAPEMLLEDANYKIMQDFKDKIRELIKNQVTIEQVCNSFDPTEKNNILKQWPKVKKIFVEKYGENNTRLSAVDIINFLKSVFDVSDTASLLGKLVKNEAIKQKIIDNREPGVYGKIDPTRNFVYIIDKVTADDEQPKNKLYLIPVKNTAKQRPRIGVLYSLTGKKTPVEHQDKLTSFREFPLISDKFLREDLTKVLKEIFTHTMLTADDILRTLNIGNFDKDVVYNSLVNELHVTPINENPGDAETFKVTSKKTSSSKNPYVAEYGYGIINEKLPKLVEFGKLKINLKKLKYDDILCLKNANGTSIGGLPNLKISDRFSKILMNLLKGIYPHRDDLTSLHSNEKQVYDRIIVMSGLHKTVINDHSETLSDVKKRIDLLIGEIEIGNDSPLIKTELKQLAGVALSMKGITNKEYNKFINQFDI